MTDRPPPRVLAVFTGPISRTWLVASCPYCQGQHEHPAGPAGSDERRTLGHRVAGCPNNADLKGYVLVTRLPTITERTMPRQQDRHGEGTRQPTASPESTYSTSAAPGASTGPTDKRTIADLLYNNYSDWKEMT